MLIQSNSYRSYLCISAVDFGPQREDQNQARRRFPLLFRRVLRTLTFWLTRAFLNDTREFDQYIAYGTIRGNMQQIHIRVRRPNEVVKTAEKILLNPVIEKIDEFKQRRFALKKMYVEDIF